MAEWLRVVIAFGSGVEGLSVPYPHPHTTHDSILTLRFHPLHAEHSAVHPRAEAAVCLLTQLGFNLHDGGQFPAHVQVHGLFIPHAEGKSVHPHVHRMVRSFLMVVSSPHAGRVVHSDAVRPSVVAFFHSRRDQRVVLSRPYLLTQPGEELCIGGQLHFPTEWKSGMFFLCFGPTDCVLGLLSSPRALLAVVSKFVLGQCGLPIRWLCVPLSTLGVGFFFVLWTV